MAVSAVAGEKVRRKLEGSKAVLCGHPLSFILSITRNSGALLSLRTLALWSSLGPLAINLSSLLLSFIMETSLHLVKFLQLLIQKNGTKVGSLFNGWIINTRRVPSQVMATGLCDHKWGICTGSLPRSCKWINKYKGLLLQV